MIDDSQQYALCRRHAITQQVTDTSRRRVATLLRLGAPALLLGILWFPFDWLSEVWPTFGAPFRLVFRNAHDHFIGHTVFFLIVGLLLLAYIPALRRPYWYIPALAIAALTQETVQAIFRGETPTYTDTNAFAGDTVGSLTAFALWFALAAVIAYRRRKLAEPKAQT